MSDGKSSILVEACVASLESARLAQSAGADRIELNSALELDGLTPSSGLVRLVTTEIRIPVIAMARPRGGDFVYSEGEWNTLLADAEWLLENGVDGLAFGCLDKEGNVDLNRCRDIKSLSGNHELVFHKAFDETADWKAAIDVLVEAGIHRVMTSGQQPDAESGIETIGEIVAYSGHKIEVLPAGGITSVNAVKLIEQTGCGQVHGSFSKGPQSDVSAEICQTIQSLANAVKG